jgi:RHS repeat-associated protein
MRLSYNDSANTATVTDPIGNTATVTLNKSGQAITVVNTAGGSYRFSYLNGFQVGSTDPLGKTSSQYYDSVGERLQTTDMLNNTWTDTWTPLGQLAIETSPLGAVTTYGYDAAGNLTSLSDADGHTTTLAYDGTNKLVRQTDPLGQATTFAYDHDGNLTSKTDANGTKTTNTYDLLNRQAKTTYGAVTGGSTASTVTNSHDLAGRLTKSVDSLTGTYSFTYDGLDDVLSQNSPQGTVRHTYDLDGQATSMTPPGQPVIKYSYDGANRRTKIVHGTSTVSFGYGNLSSRPNTVSLPDGIVGQTSYDADSRPTSVVYSHGSAQVGSLGYTYDADNRIVSQSGTLATVNLPSPTTGNTFNADNELTASNGTSLTYSKNGNLIFDGTNTYGWNARNELTNIAGATTASFAYNPFGQRTTSTIGSASTGYLYDGSAWDSNIIQELSGTTPTENLLTGRPGQILQGTTPSGTNSSYLTNPLGSTVALADPTGAVATTYTYTPSGAVTTSGAPSTNNLEFNASQNDSTGLYLMGARYYNPTSATFTSQDPLSFAGGSTNLYGYAQSDPIDRNDPTGCTPHGSCVAADALGFGLIACAAGIVVAMALAGSTAGLGAPLLVVAIGYCLGFFSVGAAVGALLGELGHNCPD